MEKIVFECLRNFKPLSGLYFSEKKIFLQKEGCIIKLKMYQGSKILFHLSLPLDNKYSNKVFIFMLKVLMPVKKKE